VHDWKTAGRKQEVGRLELLYRNPPLAQEQAETPGMTQAAIEDRLWANRRAIVQQLDAHRSLDGAIVALGPFEESYNPDGVAVTWDNTAWIGLDLLISYSGPLQLVPPTGA
jgi:uncharacterized protein involved in copper resistance